MVKLTESFRETTRPRIVMRAEPIVAARRPRARFFEEGLNNQMFRLEGRP